MATRSGITYVTVKYLKAFHRFPKFSGQAINIVESSVARFSDYVIGVHGYCITGAVGGEGGGIIGVGVGEVGGGGVYRCGSIIAREHDGKKRTTF
ncbi:hypothetical protein J6590_090650 [Homalodisca vitripennis]|nr:hypothetical protein J6590_090650 [Homalodisca vitripennis]